MNLKITDFKRKSSGRTRIYEYPPPPLNYFALHFKNAVKSVLGIGSAHNKGRPADINIAQISHLSNFSDTKLWFLLIYEHNKPEQVDIH